MSDYRKIQVSYNNYEIVGKNTGKTVARNCSKKEAIEIIDLLKDTRDTPESYKGFYGA